MTFSLFDPLGAMRQAIAGMERVEKFLSKRECTSKSKNPWFDILRGY